MTTSNKAQMIRRQFVKALVKKYGEGTVVTLAKINAVRDQLSFKKYENAVIFLRKCGMYKIARNQYLVTASLEPADETKRIKTLINRGKTNRFSEEYQGKGSSKKQQKRKVHLKPKGHKPNYKFVRYDANEGKGARH